MDDTMDVMEKLPSKKRLIYADKIYDAIERRYQISSRDMNTEDFCSYGERKDGDD